MRIQLLQLTVIALLAGCSRGPDRPSSAEVASLMHSHDRISVYDAGVAAYRNKDYEDARRLWRRAAELGDDDAASNLGFLLYYGFGGAADSVAAASLWRQAMAAGNAEAHRHVAQAIYDGNRSLGSETDAYAHAIAAQELSHRPNESDGERVAADAEKLLDSLDARLSAREREEARRLGRQWATVPNKR